MKNSCALEATESLRIRQVRALICESEGLTRYSTIGFWFSVAMDCSSGTRWHAAAGAHTVHSDVTKLSDMVSQRIDRLRISSGSPSCALVDVTAHGPSTSEGSGGGCLMKFP